jgi:hypothetical protein
MDTLSGHGEEHGDTELQRPELPPSAAEPRHGHPTAHLEPAEPLRLGSDRDLSRMGMWSLALGGVGFLVGITFLLAGGILPGALVVAVAMLVAGVGALSLLLVAHHQG